MKESNNLAIRKIGVKHFNRIQFGGRSFYIPLQFHAIIHVSDSGNKLFIDFDGGKGAYCLVNGIRCGGVVTYSKNDDTVCAQITDYTMDGVPVIKNGGTVSTKDGVQFTSSPITVEFKFDDREILYTGEKVVPRKIVVPQRFYAELTSSFLSANPQLDSRIHDFLQKHPECFGNGTAKGNLPPNYVNEWFGLHESLTLFETDEEYREHIGIHRSNLEDNVFQMFKEEEFKL